MIRVLRRVAVVALLLLLVAACAPSHSVRIEPATGRRLPRAGSEHAQQYEVRRGDTLYGIAFRHGMDYRDLARINGIAAPYTIYPGQRLRLQPGSAAAPAAGRGPGVVASAVEHRPAPTPARPPGRPFATTAKPAPASPPSASPRPATPAAGSAAPTVADGPVHWRWPTEGGLLATYAASDPTRQGINIAGNAGQAVRAAADGVVVYSGSGLIGYGELIIIKHSDEWLSAYGHNRKRLVSEGAAVKGGQQIAEMGRSGASRDMLHFEIRRNGKPVDPLALLPKR